MYPHHVLRKLHAAYRRPFSVSQTARLSESSLPKLLGRHRVCPIDLFRVNAGGKVVLRDLASQKKRGRPEYDVEIHPDKKVHPKLGDSYGGPNGALMYPNGALLQEIVRNSRSRNTTIYLVSKDTNLWDELELLHEHSSQFSLQSTRPMSLGELNTTITAFMRAEARGLSKTDFEEQYSLQT